MKSALVLLVVALACLVISISFACYLAGYENGHKDGYNDGVKQKNVSENVTTTSPQTPNAQFSVYTEQQEGNTYQDVSLKVENTEIIKSGPMQRTITRKNGQTESRVTYH